jgi:hypothetical protein
MLVSRKQLEVAKFAPPASDCRPVLQQIQLDPDGTTWASDGSIAIQCKPNGIESSDCFPAVPGVPADTVEPTEPICLPAALSLTIAKAIPKSKALPSLEYASITIGGDTVYIAVTDLATQQVFTARLVHLVDYVDLSSVWPNGDATEFTSFQGYDIDKLHQLMTFAKTPKQSPCKVDLQLRDLRAATLTWSKGSLEYEAILMPMRKD